MPLVSIEEAVKPLVPLVCDVERKAHNAKQRRPSTQNKTIYHRMNQPLLHSILKNGNHTMTHYILFLIEIYAPMIDSN